MDASLETLLAHRAWVRALAAALAQPADAEDLEQEAWLAAIGRPPHDEAPRAWLATVLRRTASKMRRTLARRAARERAAARPEATAAAADLVARAETHERVVRAVLALPEPYRSTILLRFFEGLAPREIARRTGTPIDTVKARLRRGLERLRANLPEDRAWSTALLALAVPRRPLTFGAAMTLKTKLAIVAAALLVGTSLAAYRALDRAPGTSRAATDAGGFATLPGSAGAGEPATREADAGEPAAPGAPSLPPDAPRREFVVRGVVRAADGPVHADARMMRPLEPSAIGPVNNERRLWQPMETTGSVRGEYELRVPFLADEAPCEIDFAIGAFGFVRQSRRLVVEPGGEYRADFVLEPGVVIAGTVVDPDGRPVPDAALLAVASRTPPWGIVTADMLDTERLLLASEPFARGQADESGRFEIRGLVAGPYALYASSADWILEHDPLEAPARDVRVVAVPAHAVTGTIRDARTGEHVTTASVRIDLTTASGWGCTKAATAKNGFLWVVWKPQEPEIEEGFEATLRVEAAGYRTAERTLAFPPGTRRVPVDLQLDGVEAEQLPVLRIEVTSTRGQMIETELSCALAAADDPSRHPAASEFHAVAPGIFELRAPAGRWSVRLAPRRSIGDIQWSGVVDLGRDEVVRCTLGPFGVVRLRPAGAGSWTAEAETPDGNRSYSWHVVEGGEIRIAAAPGEWKVGRSPERLQQGLRTIVVLDGAETVVDLD